MLRYRAIPAFAFAALLAAQQQADFRADVDLVTVACSVTDRNGAPVRNLKLEDFSLSDDGEPREIRKLWQESDLPLTIALVADVSGSQQEFVGSHRGAVAQFLKQVIGPGDRAMIVQVSRQSWLISDLTGSPADLRAAAKKIGQTETKLSRMLGPPCRNARLPSDNCGGTALWHGLYYAAMALKPVTGRKAIVVLSDGVDTGSDISLSKLIEAAQSAEAVVYSIQYSVAIDRISRMVVEAGGHELERLAHETGGVPFPNPGNKTSAVFAWIESNLRSMYVLGFAGPGNAPDYSASAWLLGKFHELNVKTRRSDLFVRSRAGYWASPSQLP